MARKLRKKPQETYQTYVFEIVDWEPSYLLGLNSGKLTDDLYWEHLQARISAKCIFPERFVGTPTRIDLVGDRQLLHPTVLEYNKEWKPLCVGVLNIKPAEAEFYASVPHDTFPGILTMLATERCRYILLHGASVRRGKSLCRSLELLRTVNLDDY